MDAPKIENTNIMEDNDNEINANPLIDSSDSDCVLLKNVLYSSSESDGDMLEENMKSATSKSN